jgi:hypothetical protein
MLDIDQLSAGVSEGLFMIGGCGSGVNETSALDA